MRNLFFFIILIASIFLYSSCFKPLKQVEPKSIEPAPQKLVVVSFIDPADTMLQVFVARSQFAFSSSNLPTTVPDASVSITDGISVIELKRGINMGFFGDTVPDKNFNLYQWNVTSDFIKEGKTYMLSVTTPHGESANAVCTVIPNTSSVISISATEKISGMNFPSPFIPQLKSQNVVAEWTDLMDMPSYYIVDIEGMYSNVSIFGKSPKNPFSMVYDTTYFTFSAVFDRVTANKNDLNLLTVFPGNNIKATFQSKDYGLGDFNFESDYGDTIYSSRTSYGPLKTNLYLTRVDDIYYNYHRSLKDFDGDNIFAEASKVFTNIQNGFGVFASKNTRIIQVD